MTSNESRSFTDSQHKWLNNASAIEEGIDCEPDDIQCFGGRARDEATDFSKSAHDGVTNLTMAASRIGGGFEEAVYFARQHGDGLQRLQMFMNDAFVGLTALGMGATAIGITYRNGDATSAATVKDVERAFSGKGLDQGSTSTVSGSSHSSGGSGKGLLPAAHDLTAQQKKDFATNPNDRSVDQTVKLGDRDTYTLPAAGANDLELLDPRKDIQATQNKQVTTG